MFNDLNFEIIANFGSFLAIFIIYFQDIKRLFVNFFKYSFTKDKNLKEDFKYVIMIFVASIPVGIFGLIFKSKLEKIASVKMVAIALLITGFTLLLIKNVHGIKEDKDINIKMALIVGLFEAFTLLPGLSRSGFVLVGSILAGLKEDNAFKYTFMLYFPVSLGAFLLSLIDLTKKGIESTLLAPYSLGLFAALIITYLTFKWFKNSVKQGNLWKFSIYCFIAGLLTLLYFR